MRSRMWLAAVGMAVIGAAAVGQGQRKEHLNPMIELHLQKKPIFGLYAPTNPRGRGNRGGAAGAAGATAPVTPPPAPPVLKTPAELAKDALAYDKSDFVFDGTMEGGVDRGIRPFTELVNALGGAATRGPLAPSAFGEDARDRAGSREGDRQHQPAAQSRGHHDCPRGCRERRRSDAGARRDAPEVQGGTRPDDVGSAPAYWGMTEKEYRDKADLWPPNPDGELTNWAIVESKAGLAKIREIAAVKGIGVLFPGAGTLRGVFTTTDAEGKRTFDAEGWEAAIQSVLAACKEFNVRAATPRPKPTSRCG